MKALLPILVLPAVLGPALPGVLGPSLPVGPLPVAGPPAVLRPSTAGPAPAATSAGSYRAPVVGAPRVLRGFSPPTVRYQAGHLGVDLADPAGAPVLAAGPGQVRFAGQVAGRSLLVIAHPDGISTEYEPVTATVTVGERVRSGQPIGRLVGRHRGCPAVGCLHWGARRAGNYLDPLSLLRPLGVVRLLPWDSPG